MARDYTHDRKLHRAEDAQDDLQTLIDTAWGAFTGDFRSTGFEDFGEEDGGFHVDVPISFLRVPLYSRGRNAAAYLVDQLQTAARLLQSEIDRQAAFARRREAEGGAND